jgi:hypothetical protein
VTGGKTKSEIIRCLKYLLARELWAAMRPIRETDHPSGWPLDRYRSINALAETVVGLYKPECMMIDGPFRTADEIVDSDVDQLPGDAPSGFRIRCTDRSACSAQRVSSGPDGLVFVHLDKIGDDRSERFLGYDARSPLRVQSPMTPGLPGSAGSASCLNGGLGGSR